MEREDIENSLKVLSHIVDDDFITTVDEARKIIRIDGETIEALQAQLPKRGKWVGVSPMVDTVQCSVCGGQLFSAELETPYCPYCGAKMEVQDEDT